MIKSILAILFLFMYFQLPAQKLSQVPDTFILGPEKYKTEVSKIFQSYDGKIDSLTKILVSSKFKIDSTKYKKGILETYIDQELNEIELIINKFLQIKRVTAIYKQTDGVNKEISYIVAFESVENTAKNGNVKWVVNFN